LNDRAIAEIGGKLFQTALEAFVVIREDQLGTFTVASLRNTVSDRTVGIDTRDQKLLTGQNTHQISPDELVIKI
jgi:hypothetical protein